MSHLSHIQTPEPPSPEPPEPYATLRDDELVDTETLIAELNATEPISEPQNLATNLSQSEKFVDTEQWLDELCAELTANPTEPTETEPTDIEVLVWQCERCGRVFERLIEADLFGSPKCRYCGGTLKICWRRGDSNEPPTG
jgi:protein-arginine kinase activator protein McsA